MADHSMRVHDNDILMGRGGFNHQHNGNEQLRRMARERVNDYRRATKKQKAVITEQVLKQVQSLTPPGRFLRRNISTFFEVNKREAREKVCQTLRDAVSDANAARCNGDVENKDDDQRNDYDYGNEEDEMSVLPVKEDIIDNFNSFPTDQIPLVSTSLNFSISPDKIALSTVRTPTTVTPTNQQNGTTSPLSLANPSCSLTAQEYDAYNYLSRVSINDDFDLFDGELLKSAVHDEVFASMRLS